MGKKIAYGFGKQLGDEDLCGHEDPPTLQDCQKRIKAEENLLEEMCNRIAELAIEDKELDDMVEEDLNKLKEKMMEAVDILSERVKELKTVIMKKKYALSLVMKKVEGEWKKSPNAAHISFLQTKIIQCQSCYHSLFIQSG